MDNELAYKTVVGELLKVIPELQSLYVENEDMWGDDYLPYVVFGSAGIPKMEYMLKTIGEIQS